MKKEIGGENLIIDIGMIEEIKKREYVKEIMIGLI